MSLRAHYFVIASAAKQSPLLYLDCFAALAMTGSRNDGILEFIKIFSKSGFGVY